MKDPSFLHCHILMSSSIGVWPLLLLTPFGLNGNLVKSTYIEASLFDASARLIKRFPLKTPLPRHIKILHHGEYEGEEIEYWNFRLEAFNGEFALYISDLNITQN